MSIVRIHGIAAGGDGVGRMADGMTVFVPRTAPGDEVVVEIAQRRRRYARGRAAELRVPGGGRVAPPCIHYVRDECGGCQLQHLSGAAQLAAKRSLVGDALRRLGSRDVEDPEIVPSPAPWRYRTKITLAVGPGRERIGLHPAGRPGEVFELRDCPITAEPLMELWGRIAARRDLLPAGGSHVVLRLDRAGARHVIVRTAHGTWDATPLAAALGEAAVSWWWHPEGGAARVIAGPVTGFPALAFAQVNPALASEIRAEAVAALLPGTTSAWDLYGGVGDAAWALAASGIRVWSVDADRSAVEWASRQSPPEGAAARPVFIHGLVEESLHRLPEPDAVLLNPPRTGAHGRVAQALERLAAWGGGRPRLAYVSCDPATLARDLARLPSYVLRRTTAFDLFPQTSHVETLAVLEAA